MCTCVYGGIQKGIELRGTASYCIIGRTRGLVCKPCLIHICHAICIYIYIHICICIYVCACVYMVAAKGVELRGIASYCVIELTRSLVCKPCLIHINATPYVYTYIYIYIYIYVCMCVCVYGGSQRVCIATPNYCVFGRTRSLTFKPCLMDTYAVCVAVRVAVHVAVHVAVYAFTHIQAISHVYTCHVHVHTNIHIFMYL